jgi:2-aminoadipate transaminase
MTTSNLEIASLAKRAAALAPSPAATIPAGAIPFESGHAFPGILPDLSAESHKALGTFRPETLQYAPRPGLSQLREWIAEYLRDDGAVSRSAEEILVTNGAKHALELVCRLLLNEGDAIVVTAPTYFTAIPIFRSFGVEFIEIAQDSDGLVVDQLRECLRQRLARGDGLPKFVYDVPDFHNPTGVTMSRLRREALLDVAEEFGIFLVEDSPYRKVRFEGESQSSSQALDRSQRVLGLGTFSKLLAPGLRIGWLSGSPDLLNRAVQLKSDGGSCPLTQRLILEFCKSGRLTEHIGLVQRTYRSHRDRMVAALAKEIPEASFTKPQGGYYLWLAFPTSIDTDALAKLALAEGAVVLPGSKFFARNSGAGSTPPAPRNYLRLAYSHATPDEIDEGISRLARAYRALTRASAGVPR